MKLRKHIALALALLLALTLAAPALAADTDTMTRGAFVEALFATCGDAETPAAQDAFSDVPAEGALAQAVRWAIDAGVVNGCGGGLFRPDAPVTREQASAMAYRYAQSRGQGFRGMWMFLLDYPDAADVSDWADEAMHWVVMQDILPAGDGGRLAPGGALDAEDAEALLAGLDTVLAAAAEQAAPDNDALYAAAVRDAVFADEDELYPLVNLTKDDESVVWDGDKVLVLFLHRYPDSYPAGEEITLQWGNVWCVSAAEAYNWVKLNGEDVDDWQLRLLQLFGMPTSKGSTTVTALWVDAGELYRPAYVTDPTADMSTALQATGDEAFDAMYKEWFDGNILWSYFDSAYPWTRLGYTYDWADNGTEYGLSEFLIFSGASARVEYTLSIDEFAAFAMSAGA